MEDGEVDGEEVVPVLGVVSVELQQGEHGGLPYERETEELRVCWTLSDKLPVCLTMSSEGPALNVWVLKERGWFRRPGWPAGG